MRFDSDMWEEFTLTPSGCFFMFLFVLWFFIAASIGEGGNECALVIGLVAITIVYIYYKK